MDRWNTAQPQSHGNYDGADGGDFELDYTVVGTCGIVPKKYLRLTSAPDPTAVRPEPVLREAVAMVKERYEGFGDERGQDQYIFLWEQMKSIRQVRRQSRQSRHHHRLQQQHRRQLLHHYILLHHRLLHLLLHRRRRT